MEVQLCKISLEVSLLVYMKIEDVDILNHELPLLGMYERERNACMQQETYTEMVIAVFFQITGNNFPFKNSLQFVSYMILYMFQ